MSRLKYNINTFYSLKNLKTGRYFSDFNNRKIRTTFSIAFAFHFACKFRALEFIGKNKLSDYIVVSSVCVDEKEII